MMTIRLYSNLINFATCMPMHSSQPHTLVAIFVQRWRYGAGEIVMACHYFSRKYNTLRIYVFHIMSYVP